MYLPIGDSGCRGFEEFDERFSGDEAAMRAPSRVERCLGHPEYVAIEGEDLVEGADGDRDVGDARAAPSRIRCSLQ